MSFRYFLTFSEFRWYKQLPSVAFWLTASPLKLKSAGGISHVVDEDCWGGILHISCLKVG